MKTKIVIAAAVVLLALSALGFISQPSRWEYKVDSPMVTQDKLDETYLSGLGAEGWELVTTERNGPKRTYFFKRPK